MSNLTVAAFSPEAAEPLPERSTEGDDVVEAYSFNTGDLSDGLSAASISIYLCCSAQKVPCLDLSHPYAGLMVLMMILYASLGHKIAARYIMFCAPL